jgi:hypothetical protein
LQSADVGVGPLVPGQEGVFASVTARDFGTARVEGLLGFPSDSEGQTLTLSGAASPEHNGEFLIDSWFAQYGHRPEPDMEPLVLSSIVVIRNSAGILADANNGSIAWEETEAWPGGVGASITALDPATATIKGLFGMTAASVGRLLLLSNAASPTNNGTFLITAYISSSSVVVSKLNGTGPTDDANNGSIAWAEHTAAATINSPTQLTLPTANITDAHVGLYVAITGSRNDGVYRITSRVSSTVVKVAASFSLPEPANGTIGWSLIDYRDGQIAKDPTDVVVRVNNVPVAVEAVIGLLGQVVLPVAPTSQDDVKIDYAWMTNPVVDFRRLNSQEFCLNNRGGRYRYSSTLIKSDGVDPVDPEALDIRALLPQPLQRDLKYRAYERAYSVALNDPNLLLLNSPNNRIAFPPMTRLLASTFVNFEGTTLPEAAQDPWQRAGAGSVSISNTDLVVTDEPGNAPIFWTRRLDLTFDHVFAHAWSMKIESAPVLQGVFTGVASGYSDGEKACVVGFLSVGGVKKFGILRRGYGNDPSSEAAWIGSVELDWSILRSYRILRSNAGEISVFVDGSVVAALRAEPDELPYLQELNTPFDALQGPFFGSLSREAESTSTWSFIRYTAIPSNPQESEPSIFVSYEGGPTTPEAAPQPWTPIGFHGTGAVRGSHLILDSTSATDQPSSAAGLISGDFKGYTRIEPLLRESFDTVLDVQLALRTYTQGIAPNAVMAAIDDGERLIQLSFLSDQASPKLSYGGRNLPSEFHPYKWLATGSQTASMVGQYLKISDASATDSLLYSVDDSFLLGDSNRVVGSDQDYIFEFRVRVVSFQPDVNGFCGVSASVYDGLKSVGIQLVQQTIEEDDTETVVRYVELHSEGHGRPDGRFEFEWNDGAFHTFRLTKSTLGDLVTVFADGQLLGTLDYSDGLASPLLPSLIGKFSFGSSTTLSVQSRSEAVWAYANCWRVTLGRRYVGLWKGYDPGALTGYHLPLSASGSNAAVRGNVLTDLRADFSAQGVSADDQLIIDSGPNKGVYTVEVVAPLGDVKKLVLKTALPSQPSEVSYRCVKQVDWTVEHRYRIVKNPTGVSVFLDSTTDPLVHADYSVTSLPPSSAGLPHSISAGLPSVTWGAFDPTNLSQTAWDFVRFGAIRSVSAVGLTPHHQIINQRNIMASYEHQRSSIAHTHTDFWSESEGIPPQTEPDLLRDPNLVAYTLLNDGTPLVPSTQSYEVRAPESLVVPVAELSDPQEILNHRGFLVNRSAQRVEVLVPDDVLYNSLQVIESTTGEADLLAPFDDEAQFTTLGQWRYTDEYHIPQLMPTGLHSLTTHSGLTASTTTPTPPVVTFLNTATDVLWHGFPSVEATFDVTLGPGLDASQPTFRENLPTPVEGFVTLTETKVWPSTRVGLLNSAEQRLFGTQGPPYLITADNLTPFPAPTSTVTTPTL